MLWALLGQQFWHWSKWSQSGVQCPFWLCFSHIWNAQQFWWCHAFCLLCDISMSLSSSLPIIIFSSDFYFSDLHILNKWLTFHSLGTISCYFPFLKQPKGFSRQYWKSTYDPRCHPFHNIPRITSETIILPGKFNIRFIFSAICRIVWRGLVSQAITYLSKILQNTDYHPTCYPQSLLLLHVHFNILSCILPSDINSVGS